MKNLFYAMITLLFRCNLLTAQCDSPDETFNAIITKYDKLYHDIEPDTTKGPWSKNGQIGWAGDVTFRMINKKISFDLISVTMKNNNISFYTPQVTMRQKKLIFKSIEGTMHTQTVGYTPTIECKWLKCKTKMKPIITKVPGFKTVSKTISTDIPEFKYSKTSFTTKIPEFKKR